MSIKSRVASLYGVRRRVAAPALAGKSALSVRALAIPVLWVSLFWAAWAIRLWQLDGSDLTFDEAATYWIAHRPLPDMLATLRAAVREHPPVYYLLIRAWMGLAGTSEYSMRFFATGASLVGIALTARLGRRLAGYRGPAGRAHAFLAACLPALILALFPLEAYHARNARMYTLVIVWAVWSALCFLPLLFPPAGRAPGSRPGWPRPLLLAGLVVVNTLAVFTHYFLGLLVIAQFASLLLLRRWRSLAAWGAAHGLLGLVGLVWVLRAPGLASTLAELWGRVAPAWPTLGQLRRLLAGLFFGPITGVPWNLVYTWGLLVIVGLLVAWLQPRLPGAEGRRAQTHRSRPRAMGVWLAVTVLLPVILAFLAPEPPQARHLILVLPFAALAVGQIPLAVTGRGRQWPVALGVSALAVATLGVYGLPRTLTWERSDYGATIATISAHARPGDAVLFYGPWQNIQYHYYQQEGFPPIAKVPQQVPPRLVPAEAEPVLQSLTAMHARLWVIPAALDDVDPDRLVTHWLDTHAHLVWRDQSWSLYLAPAREMAVSRPLGLRFDERLQLVRLDSEADAVPAGEGLRLTLTWTALDSLDSGFNLQLLLVDEQGNRWQEWEPYPYAWAGPRASLQAGEVVTEQLGLVVPQGAPPGAYTLQAVVVDPRTGSPMSPAGPPGPPGAPGGPANVDLFTFQVLEPVSAPALSDVGDFAGPFTFEAPHGDGQVTLLGYDLGGLQFQQGQPLPLRLHWLAPDTGPHPRPLPRFDDGSTELAEVSQGRGELAQDITLRLQLTHRSRWPFAGGAAAPVATHTLALAPGYPLSAWPPGRVLSLPAAVALPGDAAPGRASLTLAVYGPDGQPWTVGGRAELALGTLTIQERPMLRQLPAGLATVALDFVDQTGSSQDAIGLRGYRVAGTPEPGGHLELAYGWLALSNPQHIYAVFNHLLTPEGAKVAQVDGWPQGGVVLTRQWRSGEYIRDTYTLAIPADAPPGPYLLAVGMYDAATGQRLAVVQAGELLPNDQWLLPIPPE